MGVYGFYIFDRRLVDYFNSLGIKSGSKLNIEIPRYILNNKSLSRRFLRGLFDTDGSIYFEKNRSAKMPIHNRPNIKLGTVSRNLANDLFNLLIDLKFNPRMKKPYKGKREKNIAYNVLIYRKDDVERFTEVPLN